MARKSNKQNVNEETILNDQEEKIEVLENTETEGQTEVLENTETEVKDKESAMGGGEDESSEWAEAEPDAKTEKLMKLNPHLESMWITADGFVHSPNVPAHYRKNAKFYKNKYYKQTKQIDNGK